MIATMTQCRVRSIRLVRRLLLWCQMAICCEKCGERIRSTPYRWGSFQWLCGLCLDDLLNEDARASAQSPNSEVSGAGATASNDNTKSATRQRSLDGMVMNHDELKEAAKSAVNSVFGDRSVGPRTTIDSLEEIASDIDALIDALKSDLRRSDS